MSNPLYQGEILTPAQWNTLLASKQDAFGYTPVNKAGDSMNGRLVTFSSEAAAAGFAVVPGVSPSAPVDGDVWATTVGLFAQINGATYLLTRPTGVLEFNVTGVDFNTTGDTAIALSLPPGYTRYVVTAVRVSNASRSITTATAGLFTASGGGGAAIVTGGSAITVSVAIDATNNNTQSMTVNNKDTCSYTLANQPSLYFRIGTPQGAAATADVSVILTPLP